MLPVGARLSRDQDIKAVLKHGIRHKSPYVYMYRLPRRGEETKSRAACVVSRQVSRSSVVRHRYQRWLREWAATLLNKNTATDFVLIAQPGITTINNLKTLQDSLNEYFH